MNWEEFQRFVIQYNIKPIIYRHCLINSFIFQYLKDWDELNFTNKYFVLFNEKVKIFVCEVSWKSVQINVEYIGSVYVRVFDVEPGMRFKKVKDMETMNDEFEMLQKKSTLLDLDQPTYLLYG